MTTRRGHTPAAVGAALTVGLVVLAGTVGIGTASADDKAYLQTLHDAGINVPRGEYELKEWGWEVCALRDLGKPPRQWVEQAVYQSAQHPPYGLTEAQANLIVDTAVSDLCDSHDGNPPYDPLP